MRGHVGLGAIPSAIPLAITYSAHPHTPTAHMPWRHADMLTHTSHINRNTPSPAHIQGTQRPPSLGVIISRREVMCCA